MLGHIPMFSHVFEQDSASMNLHFPSLQIINSTRRGGKKHHFSFIDVHVLLGCLFLMVLCPCCCMTLYVYIITIHTYTHTLLLRIAYRIVKLECILRAKHSNSKPGRKQGRQEVKFHRRRFHCTHKKNNVHLLRSYTYTHIHIPFWTHQISPSSRPSPSAPPPASAAQRPRRTARSDAASWPRPSGSVAEVRSIACAETARGLEELGTWSQAE